MKTLQLIGVSIVAVLALAVLFAPLPKQRAASSQVEQFPAARPSIPSIPTPETAPVSAAESKYGVVFDAGSTGTRVHVYKFSRIQAAGGAAGAGGSDDWRLDDELNTENDVGLSSLAALSPAERAAGVRAILEPLIKQAVEYVPREQHATTTVTLRATAGLRLVSEVAADALIAAATDALKASPFVFGSCSIISGTEEGVWAWLTVNYLLGRLKPEASATVAVMDLGGASTQLVFEPRRDAVAKFVAENPERASLFYKLPFAGRHYLLYEKSHLRYGLMEARRRGNTAAATVAWQSGGAAAAAAAVDAEVDAAHPCLPGAHFNGLEASPLHESVKGFLKLSQFNSAKGTGPSAETAAETATGKRAAAFTADVDLSRPGAERFQLRGDLSAADAEVSGTAKCLSWANRSLFNRDRELCPATYGGDHFCPFDGVFQPPLNSPEWFDATGYADGDDLPSVYAFSYFYDRALAMDLVPKSPRSVTVTIDEWMRAANATCAQFAAVATTAPTTTAAAATTTPADDDTWAVRQWIKANPYLCYDVQYIAALLHHAYGLPRNTRLILAKKINGLETGWCLGSVLHDLFDDQ